ncbi:OmpH family outer membrane protein [Bacteroidota bacterium]
MRLKIFLVLIFFIQASALLAQIDKKLENRIDSLETQLYELQQKSIEKEKLDKRNALMEKAKQLSSQKKKESDDISKKFHSGIRQQQGLNPNISVGGDFFTSFSSSDNKLITESSEFSYGNNNFLMRELELGFVAPLDPFTRGKAFLSVTEGGIALEEGYMELINLPLNLNIKAGIFKPEYGLLNRYHPHALPQFDKPKALMYHFGEPGIGGAGLAANFMFPKPILAHASSLDFSVVDGGNDMSFTSERNLNLLYVGHFKNYYDINNDSYFEFTISGVRGLNDSTGNYNSHVGSFGLHYRWAPVARSKYRTFDWKTEFIYGYHEGPLKDVETFGFYSSIQNKLNARFWLAARVGYSELPYDKTEHEMNYAVCLDFWQSEFVFFRFQYQYNDRHINNMMGYLGEMPSDHVFTLHVSWAMGPHKHEAY